MHVNKQDYSVAKNTCHQPWWPEFNPWAHKVQKRQINELYIYTMCIYIPAQTSWPRRKLERKGFIQITLSILLTKGSQDWNSCRSGSKSWCRGHGGMFFTSLPPLTCSTWSLIEPRLPAQRWSHPHGAFPPWSLIEKMPYSWISWRHFLNWSSFLCDNSSLCQVERKLASAGGFTLLNW